MSPNPDPRACGSMRAVEEYEGSARATVWCDRVEGPCPWPGTGQANDRACVGSRILKVTWAESAIRGAIETLGDLSRRAGEGECPELTTTEGESLWPAIDALRACLPDDGED